MGKSIVFFFYEMMRWVLLCFRNTFGSMNFVFMPLDMWYALIWSTAQKCIMVTGMNQISMEIIESCWDSDMNLWVNFTNGNPPYTRPLKMMGELWCRNHPVPSPENPHSKPNVFVHFSLCHIKCKWEWSPFTMTENASDNISIHRVSFMLIISFRKWSCESCAFVHVETLAAKQTSRNVVCLTNKLRNVYGTVTTTKHKHLHQTDVNWLCHKNFAQVLHFVYRFGKCKNHLLFSICRLWNDYMHFEYK